ncbi:hypothetical protein KSI86_16820 [Dickeya oryzae]|uniref:hypothetical protein n=1 Tax=Dickeya oryzae TaxID=1240404 RepID=UPI002097E994|nr:hypothetical protein [Dickeya oryzae]MCO7255821.1 hypothetical protein [Dickeya oryzae]UUE11350.1 hypothetical protein NMX13_07185 [Dickeya zeae]
MKIKMVFSIFAALMLAGCSSWVSGNKMLADKTLTDQQIKAKVIDNKTTISQVNELFGDKKEEGRGSISKSFPNGVYNITTYRGHLNDLGGTYAHRKLVVAYNKDGLVINHDIFVDNFREKNKFEKDPLNIRIDAFNILNKGDSESSVLNLLGQPRLKTFADDGNVLWVYSKTAISRDASSYIPLYNYAKGTESGVSDRLYVELSGGKVENVYLSSVSITQGRGAVNAEEYNEKMLNLKKKYE